MVNFMLKKIITTALVLATVLSLSSCGEQQQLVSADNLGENDFLHNEEYELVWHDEFDGDSLNLDDWQYEIGFIRNNEPQYYTDRQENVFVKDGLLNIVALKEEYDAPGRTAEYTSGSINTQGKHSFKYGAIEMRAKLPSGNAPETSWAAFWMMGDKDYWPISGETDIVEAYGQDFYKYEANVHWADSDSNHVHLWDTDGSVPTYYSARDELGADFHTYGIDWDENRMRFYFDDVTVGEIDITGEDQAELHYANYLLLNLALQPQNVGDADDSQFPITYQVDYVRVFQKK